MKLRTDEDYKQFIDRYAQYYPRFSDVEYERRYHEIRRMMATENLDALIIYGDSTKSYRTQHNVRYVSNFADEWFSYVIFPLEGEPTQIMGIRSHLPHAKAVSVIKDVRYGVGFRGGRNIDSNLIDCIKEKKLDKGNLGIVSYYHVPSLPYHVMESLIKEFPLVRFRNITDIYDSIQAVHSLEEVAYMEKAGAFTDLAMEGMVKATKPGVTEREIYGCTHAEHLSRGGEFDFSLIGSTPMDDPILPYPFAWASNRKIQVGDIVTAEISAGYWGYSGQICRSIAVGRKPMKEWQDLFDVAVEVYKEVQKVLKPGNSTDDVAKIAKKIPEAGYVSEACVIHGLSPGAGMGFQVRIPEEGVLMPPKAVFKENVPVMIEPNPCTPDLRMGVFIGNANRITPYGGKSYQKFPMEFLVNY